MNRNNERHFNNIPSIQISRSTFKRNQKIMTTFDAGELVPFYVDEVLPGDTFRVNTHAIIRQTTPKYPVMDDAFIDFYYFYVPNRIVWYHWKQFMGEVESTPWLPSTAYSVPTIKINRAYTSSNGPKIPETGTILDYMGVPTKVVDTKTSADDSEGFEVNALPVRGYVMIWNEFFRDENVENAAVWNDNDDFTTYVPTTAAGNPDTIESRLQHAIMGSRCLPVNKFHDYFTSCLPYPQRGPEVSLPMSGNAQVGFYNTVAGAWDGVQYWLGGNGQTPPALSGSASTENHTWLVSKLMGKTDAIAYTDKTGNTPRGILTADLSTVTAASINDLRQAVAVQHYYEALARGGSRYREQIKAIWGTTISDKTVQIPEYLGGGRYHVNMNQVVQTSGEASTDSTPLGETGAVSITPVRESSFTKSFEEHGFVIGVMCVRHDRTYQQGLERFWGRKDRLDYYVPQFAHLGEQPVKKSEIMLTATGTDEQTFGYQEAWADYRMKPNRVSGKMRSNAEGTLDFWHYADNYETVPTLSQEWMSEGKAEIARTLIVQDEPQFFGGILVNNKTTRPMPLYSVPGLEKL
nr:MAG TPA: Major capsid protein [Microviridae sp.]